MSGSTRGSRNLRPHGAGHHSRGPPTRVGHSSARRSPSTASVTRSTAVAVPAARRPLGSVDGLLQHAPRGTRDLERDQERIDVDHAPSRVQCSVPHRGVEASGRDARPWLVWSRRRRPALVEPLHRIEKGTGPGSSAASATAHPRDLTRTQLRAPQPRGPRIPLDRTSSALFLFYRGGTAHPSPVGYDQRSRQQSQKSGPRDRSRSLRGSGDGAYDL